MYEISLRINLLYNKIFMLLNRKPLDISQYDNNKCLFFLRKSLNNSTFASAFGSPLIIIMTT